MLQHSSCTEYLRLLGAVTIHTYCSLPTLSHSAAYVCRLISGGVSPPQDLSVIYGYYPILYTSILFLPSLETQFCEKVDLIYVSGEDQFEVMGSYTSYKLP